MNEVPDAWTFLVAVAVIIGAFGLGWFFGERHGVEETERRWGEAVSRAEWHRKFGGN